MVDRRETSELETSLFLLYRLFKYTYGSLLTAVTHPSSNRAQCPLTTLIEANVITTTLRRHPISHANTFFLITSQQQF